MTSTKEAVAQMRMRHAALRSEDGTFNGSIGSNLRKWERALIAFNGKYVEAKGRASAHEAQLAQLGQIEQRVADLRTTIAKARRESSTLGKPKTRYAEVRKAWDRAKADRAKALQQECETRTSRSGGEIRATVRVGAGVDAVLQKPRSAVTGSGLRREKIEAIGELIGAAENPDEQWTEVLNYLEQLAGYDPRESGEKNIPTCRRSAFAKPHRFSTGTSSSTVMLNSSCGATIVHRVTIPEGQIRATGTIDVPVICDAIKQVMEGGEQAFRLRKEKYGF